MSRLEVRELTAGYGPRTVLWDVLIDVADGHLTLVLGANGAGKTSLLRAITGMLRRRGSILLDGQEIIGRSTAGIARSGIAHVPQGRGTFSDLTVEENLRVGAYAAANRNSVPRQREMVLDIFPRLGERLAQQAGTLSGGEQQMLAFGRAMMMSPSVLLLDEPSLGLAPQVVREIYAALTTLRAESKLTVLLVEQSAEVALPMAEHAYIIDTGSVAWSGTAGELGTDADLRSFYLGAA